MKRLAVLCFLTSFLVGCGDNKPELDTSSNEAFRSSLSKMEEGFSNEDKMKLEFSIAGIRARGIGDDWKSKLDGKTASEIVNMAMSGKS